MKQDGSNKTSVDPEELLRAARLVRIKVPEEEIGRYCEELGNVVEWFGVISRVKTDDIEPVSYGGAPGPLPVRQDVVDEGNLRDQIFSTSSYMNSAGCFTVKKVLG